jgi:DNA invertase Pin-like site-specific DNA recombinase
MSRRAYSYIRFSKTTQADGGSIARQTDMSRAYCERKNLVYDEQLTVQDLGVSAFRGDNVKTGALAGFVEACRIGKVPKGSVLIVESLDRLSRNQVQHALRLLLSLQDYGVEIVTLQPERSYPPDNPDPFALIEPLVVFARAHEESQMKSHRRGHAWKQARDKARQGGGPMLKTCPAWLQVVDGKFEVKPDAAATVKQIYTLAKDGWGMMRITQHLTNTGVPPLGRSGCWLAGYVYRILRIPAAMGAYQPRRKQGRKLVNDGELIAGYYPAVVSEQEWHQVQAAIEGRCGELDENGKFQAGGRGSPAAGRRGTEETNLFAGLLYAATTGDKIHTVLSSGRPNGDGIRTPYRYLCQRRGARIVGRSQRLNYEAFEAAVLSCFKELKPADIMPDDGHVNGREAEIARLSGRLLDIDSRLERAQHKAQTAADFDMFLSLIESLQTERREVSKRLAELREQEASQPAIELGESQGLIAMLTNAPVEQRQELRRRLKQRIRQLVASVWLLIVRRGGSRICAVQIFFAGGERRRDYLILHKPGRSYGKGRREAEWFVRSFDAAHISGELDLRKRDHARKLEKALAKIDHTAWE